MPRLTEQRRQDRREQIADAAMRCFARQGFAATSMADIIAESGLSAGSIYSHFAGKADLVRFASAARMERQFTDLAADLATTAAGGVSPTLIASRILDSIGRQRPQARLLVQMWLEGERDEEIGTVIAGNILRVRDLISSLLAPWAQERRERTGEDADEAVRDAAELILTILQGFMLRIMLDPQADSTDLAGRIIAALDWAPGARSARIRRAGRSKPGR